MGTGKGLASDLIKELVRDAAAKTAQQASAPAASDEPADEVSRRARLSTLLPFPGRVEASEIDDQEALTAIEQFFAASDPIERDVLLEALAANPSGHAREFLAAARDNDPDPYLRAQATEALVRRGDPAAIRALYETLADPEEPALLNHAIQVLAHVQGETFAEALLALWRDGERSFEERREALLGLEQLVPARAIELFRERVRAIDRAAALDDDELSVLLSIFVRQEASAAVGELRALAERLRADPAAAAEDLELILDEIEAAVDLLS